MKKIYFLQIAKMIQCKINKNNNVIKKWNSYNETTQSINLATQFLCRAKKYELHGNNFFNEK